LLGRIGKPALRNEGFGLEEVLGGVRSGELRYTYDCLLLVSLEFQGSKKRASYVSGNKNASDNGTILMCATGLMDGNRRMQSQGFF